MNASYYNAAGYTISLFVRRTGQLKRSVKAVVVRCYSSPSFGTSVGGIQHPMRMCTVWMDLSRDLDGAVSVVVSCHFLKVSESENVS